MVRAEGLEPPRLASQEPKSCASASSATPARDGRSFRAFRPGPSRAEDDKFRPHRHHLRRANPLFRLAPTGCRGHDQENTILRFANGVAAAVGRTPLIKLRRASEETGCTILGKAEFMNPGQSVK